MPSRSLVSPLAHTRRLWARHIAPLAVVGALVSGCGNDLPLDIVPRPAAGIVVLDGFIQPALTLLADSGSTSSRIPLGLPTEFDAGAFSLTRDTILAVSSRSAGDLLYVADLRTGTMRRYQMPTRSNPGRARLFTGGNGQALIGVALRDSNSVAVVSVAGAATPTITRISNAGTCPTDMFQYDNATWVVDANANCKTNYTIQGDVRLIRIPTTGTTRDTLLLPGMRGSSASAIVVGDVAYVSAGGDVSFASFPYTVLASGRITKVDLRNRRVLTTQAMPTSSYGASTRLGFDGHLYISLYEDVASFRNRTIKLRTSDLSIVGAPASTWLALKSTTGADVDCGSSVADALGRVHCIVNGLGSVTSLVVFDANGFEIRRVGAGQGGVDLALR